MKQHFLEAVERGREYLRSKISGGLCYEDFGLRHGPSVAWIMACVGSTFAELGELRPDIAAALHGLQHKSGGWSYNQQVPADCDTTLRVLQFLRKLGYDDKDVLQAAWNFVIRHQQPDGGFSTFRSEATTAMGYSEAAGWTSSHPCVTALAVSELVASGASKEAERTALSALSDMIQNYGLSSYWWNTRFYMAYENGLCPNGAEALSIRNDSIEIALALLTAIKLELYAPMLAEKLLAMQLPNGQFPPSRQLLIPQPSMGMRTRNKEPKIASDANGILSTCAAVVALKRHSEAWQLQ